MPYTYRMAKRSRKSVFSPRGDRALGMALTMLNTNARAVGSRLALVRQEIQTRGTRHGVAPERNAPDFIPVGRTKLQSELTNPFEPKFRYAIPPKKSPGYGEIACGASGCGSWPTRRWRPSTVRHRRVGKQNIT